MDIFKYYFSYLIIFNKFFYLSTNILQLFTYIRTSYFSIELTIFNKFII
nr:MAG TPA: hypothetical protein [Caudoviricetes sp.]